MVFQQKEYSKLRQVIVCPPVHMKITKVINETQKHFIDDNIDTEKAEKQHQQFTNTLRDQGVNVFSLDAIASLNEQVFTRDIGFTIDDTVFISSMARDIRKKEIRILEDFLNKQNIPYIALKEPSIEGGDVVIHGDTIYIGISERTTRKAIAELQSYLKDKEVIPLPLREDILHLDCAFNIISEDEALIYSPAFKSEDVKRLSGRFSLIETPEEEQLTLATNVVSIGNNTIISLPENKQTNLVLREKGYNVIENNFSEIIKSGGSFRCCTMPILREK